jgi:hypothetical protein
MIEVVFQFSCADDLWAFRIEALVDFVSMDKDKNVLVCMCLSQHVELAKSKYKAVVLVNQNEGWD